MPTTDNIVAMGAVTCRSIDVTQGHSSCDYLSAFSVFIKFFCREYLKVVCVPLLLWVFFSNFHYLSFFLAVDLGGAVPSSLSLAELPRVHLTSGGLMYCHHWANQSISVLAILRGRLPSFVISQFEIREPSWCVLNSALLRRLFTWAFDCVVTVTITAAIRTDFIEASKFISGECGFIKFALYCDNSYEMILNSLIVHKLSLMYLMCDVIIKLDLKCYFRKY